jgi:hypothetical protein
VSESPEARWERERLTARDGFRVGSLPEAAAHWAAAILAADEWFSPDDGRTALLVGATWSTILSAGVTCPQPWLPRGPALEA